MFRQRTRSSYLAAALLALGAGSAYAQSGRTVTVAAQQSWTDTGIDVTSGQTLVLDADGQVRPLGWHFRDWLGSTRVARTTGPQGTYLWPLNYMTRHLPLPSVADGPWPAFCLIAKIGEDGTPFYAGAHYQGLVNRSGRLWLGINDDKVRDNRGHFSVTISDVPRPQPLPTRAPVIEPNVFHGRPVANARVLLVYVDGLRPDVLRDLAAQGFLPHFKEAFLDQGVWVEDAFSTFPSNTLIANGALFTGRFPDGTAIKSQNQFERSTLKPRGQLSAWLPDGFMPKPTTRVLNLLDKYAPENTHQFMVDRHVPTLATRLGAAYRFTTLPIAPLHPPPQWFHVVVNILGPINLAMRLPTQLDRVNARYAIDQMLGDPYARVMAVWFPMVDKTSHRSPHGQFGAARRDLVLADKYFGQLLKRLHELRWDQSTYLILVSDHGHVGGDEGTNRVFNVPRDWAYRYLGCNAKVVDNEWVYPGIDLNHFIFFDNQGAGQAKIFLPHGACATGPWRRNRLYELTHYRLPANRRIDLLESLETFQPEGSDSSTSPVDLILVKLDERRILVRHGKDNQAMIHRIGGSDQEERYRYEPVQQVEQTMDGEIHSIPAVANRDPLGYLQDSQFLSVVGSPAWIDQPHTADEWLLATRHTAYPDAVVAMTKFFAWRESFKDLAEIRDPDLLMTASRGWSFRSDGGQGTDHGYPLAESMRITFVVSGPHVVHGIWSFPQRIIDVLPTILDMIQVRYQPSEIDGRPLDGIYQ